MDRAASVLAALAVALAGCATASSGGSAEPGAQRPTSDAPSPTEAAGSEAPVPTPTPERTPPSETDVAVARPDWLGTRVLPDRGDGFGEVQDTPSELVDRRLPPPPPQDVPVEPGFRAEVSPVPADVLERSTWEEGCPVAAGDLAYVSLTYLGFDGETHQGELLVHRDVADDVVAAFAAAYEERFPIEEMRVVARDELDAPPTGDGNNTTAFVCRPTVGRTRWSAHAFGRAVDVNPFHNPFLRDDGLVVPELASAYTDRDDRRPGMLYADSAIVRVLTDRGWGWGGDWDEPVDWMHLSESGG